MEAATPSFVIPAKAGISVDNMQSLSIRDPRLRGDDRWDALLRAWDSVADWGRGQFTKENM